MTDPITDIQNAIKNMFEHDERMQEARAERIREVNKNPHKSSLGKMLDSIYIQNGPLIVSPATAEAIAKAIDEAEAKEASNG